MNKVVLGQRWDLAAVERKGASAFVAIGAACSNRYDHALAFYIRHRFAEGYKVHLVYGPIYFLPDISLDEDETLLIVLRDFCDAASELPEPEWVSGFRVPGQKPVDDRIAQIKATLEEQQVALAKARLERVNVRTCLKLLYEREYALEPVLYAISFGSLEPQLKTQLRRTRRTDGSPFRRPGRITKGFSKSRARSLINLTKKGAGSFSIGWKEDERFGRRSTKAFSSGTARSQRL